MAITSSVLTQAGNLADQDGYATASISPAADALILAWIATQANEVPNTPTLSGNGITWTEAATAQYSFSRMTLFRGSAASPTAGAVTISLGGQTQVNARWAIIQHEGVILTEGNQGVVQAVAADGNGTAMAVALAAFADAGNTTVEGGAITAGTSITPEAGYTQLSNGASGQLRLATAHLDAEDTTPTMTRDPSGTWGMISAELAAVGGGGGGSVPTPVSSMLSLLGVGT